MAFDNITAALLRADVSSETDLSREVLSTIFGDHWWDLSAEVTETQGIFELFMALNCICAVVIAWLMILALIISSTGAAQEGRALGGKYLNPWVPIRFAFSIAAVTPLVHGLCAMQVMLLACVGVSINMANTMLDTALVWVQKNSSLTAVNNSTASEDFSIVNGSYDVGGDVTGASRTGGKTLAVQILRTEAFLVYLNSQLGCDTPASDFASHLTAEQDAATGDIRLFFSADGLMQCARGPVEKDRSVYGGFVIPKNSEDDVVIPLPQEERIRLLKELVREVEETGAPARFARRSFQAQEMAGVIEDRALVQAKGAAYAARLAVLTRGLGVRGELLQAKLDAFMAQMRSLGWFGLGSRYWTLATLEQELQACDNVNVEWMEPRYRSFVEILPASFATSFWPRINEASYPGDSPSADIWGKLREYLSPFAGVSRRFAHALGESHDSLLAMVHLARWVSGTCSAILVAAEGAKLAAIGSSKILTKNALGRVGDFFTGAGEAGDSVAKALIDDISFFLQAIVIPLWVFSTFVAYLVPAIPFLIWIAAIAGWVVITLEAVIAAPVWLIGHALPEGEGFAGQHGRSGYMLVLSVVLRPCLLVLSMLACFMVMRATGSIIGALCGPFIESQAELSSVTLGIVGCIFLFIIICGAVTLLTWKLFELVTRMPDRIIRWVGQQIATMGNEAGWALGMRTFRGAERSGAILDRGRGLVRQQGSSVSTKERAGNAQSLLLPRPLTGQEGKGQNSL